jgi:uncharacterized membrane protein (UPF0127 family)
MALLRNATTGTIVATRIERLSGLFRRAVGLLARASVQRDEGVWLTSCRSIHTIGMRAVIDVIFVDGEGGVLRIDRNVAPNRLVLSCRRARAVVELGGGALDQADVMLGDRLELVSTGARTASSHRVRDRSVRASG